MKSISDDTPIIPEIIADAVIAEAGNLIEHAPADPLARRLARRLACHSSRGGGLWGAMNAPSETTTTTTMKSFKEQWPANRRQNWPCSFEVAALAKIDSLEAGQGELIAALRSVLNAPGEGYVSPSEPDSFETQCRNAEQLLNRLDP